MICQQAKPNYSINNVKVTEMYIIYIKCVIRSTLFSKIEWTFCVDSFFIFHLLAIFDSIILCFCFQGVFCVS